MLASTVVPAAPLGPGIPLAARPSTSSEKHFAGSVADAYGKLPLSFEANRGQTDTSVDYVARGAGYTLFLTRGKAVLALRATHLESRAERAPTTVLWMELIGANPDPPAAALEALPGKANYFIGTDPARWRTDIPTYARVVYADIYPGIDLTYYGSQGRLEFDFVATPGASPAAIALHFDGADQLALDPEGSLVLQTARGDLHLEKPVLYQQVNGGRRPIAGGYTLRDGSVGFEVGPYDATKPLIIDPQLVYSTFIGGAGGDNAQGVAVDSFFNAYVTGGTASTNFPTTPGAFQTTIAGGGDTYVAKLDPAGTTLVYSTYLGGSGDEDGRGIVIDSLLNAYVTGITQSTNFPTTPGALQTVSAGSHDLFVTKLNPTGSALAYSTYLGGGGSDFGLGIAVDLASNVYVTGTTNSTNFPTTSGAFDTTFNGVRDAFVTKLNAAGTALLYSTYLGGSGSDVADGIVVDSLSSAYIAGQTHSANFPATAGAFQTSLGGPDDAFVTKLDPTGSGLLYSTYLGGGSDDGAGANQANGSIALDSLRNAYVTGTTNSTNFPTTVGAFQTALAGGNDAFVTKLDASGSALVYSTYLGGSGFDNGYAVSVDSSFNAYLTGQTLSTNFPTTAGAFQAALGGGDDAFVTKLNPTGSALAYSTYLGGSGTDIGVSIVVDSLSSSYVAGFTVSANFPTTAQAFDTTFNGGGDAFVAKIAPIGPSATPATLTLSPAAAENTVGQQHCVTATVTDAPGNPMPGVMVDFDVVGAQATFSTPSSGTVTTNSQGQATFCFTASLPGENVIHAFADSNANGAQDAGEPFGDATKTWAPPTSTQLCEVTITDGGWITTNNGDRANFGGNAKVFPDGTVQGQQEYQDQGPMQPTNVHSITITATTCSADRTTASIFGRATVDGAGSHVFRIDVTDVSSGINSYGIMVDTGYISGQHTLGGGQITIHQ